MKHMPALAAAATLVALFLAHARAQPAPREPWSLRLVTDDGTINCLPDGSHPIERAFKRGPDGARPPALTYSPDWQRALLVRDGAVYLADGEGNNAKRISSQELVEAGAPAWSADGRRVTFVAREGRIAKVFYPVFPPDSHAAEVLSWLGGVDSQ